MTSITTRFALGASVVAALFTSPPTASAQDSTRAFRVIAFFTGKQDQAHISFVHEAERGSRTWRRNTISASTPRRTGTTSNADFLAKYQVVVFLDTRPEDPAQRAAFQAYMEHGGAWMGFHFAGFALDPSVVSGELELVSRHVSSAPAPT